MIQCDRYELTVPTHDNDGERVDDCHASVRATLKRKFGGWSEYGGHGQWQDIREEHILYVVDVPANDANAYDIMHALAKRVCKQARQECVRLVRLSRNRGVDCEYVEA